MSLPREEKQYLSSLAPDSQAFGFLEYFLRLSLHTSTTRILEAWEVSNPQLTVQFERRAKETLTLDSWVECGSVESRGDVGRVFVDECNVIGSGFDVGATGIRMSVGRMTLDDCGEKIIRKRMLLSKVAVGRAYNATADFARIANVPEGYDSFVLDSDDIDFSQEDSSNETTDLALKDSNERNVNDVLTYVVKESAQLLPTYVVVFEHDTEKENRSRQTSICDNCEMAPAAVYCSADNANLCSHCDDSLHATKLTSRHIRTALDARQTLSSYCRSHPDRAVEFFCPTCSRPVCVNCKMVGHHSSGDAARHRLVPVAEAFGAVLAAARDGNDPLLEARKKTIDDRMMEVKQRAQLVRENAASVKRQLEELYKRALVELRSVARRKLNVLKGEMVALGRESSECRMLDEYLAYQLQGASSAVQFIMDWGFHQRLRAELHAFEGASSPYLKRINEVAPDMRIAGSIQISVDGESIIPGGRSRQPTAGMNISNGLISGNTAAILSGSPAKNSVPRTISTVDFSNLTKTNNARRPIQADQNTAIPNSQASSTSMLMRSSDIKS